MGGDAPLYEKYLARSRSASNPEEHYRYMYALASFSDPALVRRTMDYILGPDVRNQDAKLFIARLLGNRDVQALAWQLLQERWNDVQKKTEEFVGNTVIVGALGSFCDARTLAQVRQYLGRTKCLMPSARFSRRSSASTHAWRARRRSRQSLPRG